MDKVELLKQAEIERLIANSAQPDGVVPTYWTDMQRIAGLRMKALRALAGEVNDE